MNRPRPLLPWILLLALANGLLWMAFVPPWQGVDEPKHFELVRLIAERGRVVAFTTEEAGGDPELQRWIVDSMNAHHFWWYGHAPGYDPDKADQGFGDLWFMGAGSALARTSPIYHGLVALLQPGDRMLGLYVARLVSVLLGVLIVLFAGAVARELFPGDVLVRYGTPLFLALAPMFAFLHAGVNNDALVDALAALAFLLLTRLVVRGGSASRLLLLAGVIAVAVATKRTSLVLVPVAALAVLAWRTTRARRPWAAAGAWTAIALAAAAVAGLWATGGGWTALPEAWRWRIVQYLFNDPDQPARIAAYLRAPGVGAVIRDYAWGIHNSFWASFGWQMVNLPAWAYGVFGMLGLVAAAGLVRRWGRIDTANTQRAAVFVFAAAVGATASVAVAFFLAYLNLPYPVPPQGRYLYVTAVPIALLLVAGIGAWVPPARRARALVGLCLVMAVFDMVSLFGFVVPFFYR